MSESNSKAGLSINTPEFFREQSDNYFPWADYESLAMISDIFEIISDTLLQELLRIKLSESTFSKEIPGEEHRLVIVANPKCGIRFRDDYELDRLAEEIGCNFDAEMIYDDQLLVHYDPDDVITLGGVRYLNGSIVIFEMDEDGNACSVTKKTVENLLNYLDVDRTYLLADHKKYPVFRLV